MAVGVGDAAGCIGGDRAAGAAECGGEELLALAVKVVLEEGGEVLAEVARRNSFGDAVQLGFAATGRRTSAMVSLEKAGYGFPLEDGSKRWLFRDLSFSLGPGDRLGLLGPNGCGK